MNCVIGEIREDYVNATEGYSSGGGDFYTPFTDNRGELFRNCQKEYGRCISKMYRDYNGQALFCGWVFQKRVQYDDSADYFLQETWVEIRWVVAFN